MADILWTFGDYDFYEEGNPSGFNFGGSFRLGETVLPRKHGSVIVDPAFKESSAFSVSGSLGGLGETAAQLRTKFDDLCYALSQGRQMFKVWDDRYIYAAPETFQWNYASGGELRSIEFIIGFKSNDPYWEAVTASTASGTTDIASMVLANGGNAPAWPIVTITAPAGGLTSVTIANATTGKTFSWSGSLTSSQALVVDMGEGTITEAGVPSEDLSGFGGVFWSLSPGNNTVSISSVNTGATVAGSWRNRWE